MDDLGRKEQQLSMCFFTLLGCFLFIFSISLVACKKEPPPPSSPSPPAIELSLKEQAILDLVIEYRKKLRSDLNESVPNGRKKYFEQEDLDGYIRKLSDLTRTKAVTEELRNLVEIRNKYFEVGYKREEMELITYSVKPNDFGRPQSIAEISLLTRCSEKKLILYNPNDIRSDGQIVSYDLDSLPVLVCYRQKRN